MSAFLGVLGLVFAVFVIFVVLGGIIQLLQLPKDSEPDDYSLSPREPEPSFRLPPPDEIAKQIIGSAIFFLLIALALYAGGVRI